jgi:pimeloyl-ACP methyl ester carboxylesterase
VAGLIGALGLHKPVVIGHSMGAMTAAVLGATYPTLAGRIVLEDPPFRVTATSAQERAAQATGWAGLMARMKMATLEQIMANQPAVGPRMSEWDKSELAPWYEAKQQVNPAIVGVISATPPDWQDVIGKIACPTLLLWSEAARGGIVTEQVSEIAAALNPHIRPVHVANAGHNIRREGFEQYLSAVTAFLSDAAM